MTIVTIMQPKVTKTVQAPAPKLSADAVYATEYEFVYTVSLVGEISDFSSAVEPWTDTITPTVLHVTQVCADSPGAALEIASELAERERLYHPTRVTIRQISRNPYYGACHICGQRGGH